ncbi:MAG: hypothetical protein R3B09_05875 [Nannocystaceae bacterium]
MLNTKLPTTLLISCLILPALAACDEAGEPGPTAEDHDAELAARPWIGLAPLGDPDLAMPASLDGPPRFAAEIPTQASHHPKFKHVSPKPKHLIGWTRWALAQSFTDGPINDATGEHCGDEQSGPIWYLAGTFGGPVERECTVPFGKKLVFPLMNGWCVFPVEHYPDQASIDAALPEIEGFYTSFFDEVCSLTLRVDGVDVRPDLETLREDTYLDVFDPFEIELTEDHWAPSFAGGTMDAVTAGYFAVIHALSPGDHVIEFGGENCAQQFSTSASYSLHVGS